MIGKGFARRVTLEALSSFASLLGKRAILESSDVEVGSGENSSAADIDPAVRELFAGTPVKTGVSFRYDNSPESRRSDSPNRSRKPEIGEAKARPQVLLMRVRPRRSGTQVQISLVVHGHEFMNKANQVVSAHDGSVRPIGFDHVNRKGGRVKNLARFEAPELKGMEHPVARFSWREYPEDSGEMALHYKIFDAATDAVGQQILTVLESGIGPKVNTDLRRLGLSETVLSKGNRQAAQWYRLN